MPRPGPRRQVTTIRLSATELHHIHTRAGRETSGNKSELIRRVLNYGLLNMPADWKPDTTTQGKASDETYLHP